MNSLARFQETRKALLLADPEKIQNFYQGPTEFTADTSVAKLIGWKIVSLPDGGTFAIYDLLDAEDAAPVAYVTQSDPLFAVLKGLGRP